MPAYRFNRATGFIRYARRNVGTVRQDGAQFIARIGQHYVTSYSAESAFHEVAARALGYPNAAALNAHNRNVRANNRERNRAIRSRQRQRWSDLPTYRPNLNAEQLTMQLQRERAEIGEPPLTAEQLAAWTRR